MKGILKLMCHLYPLWNDVGVVSALGTFLKCFGALIGVLVLIFGFRESTLRERVKLAEKTKWTQELQDATDKANKALVKHQGRVVTDDQVTSFVENTKNYPKGPVKVHVYYNSPEPSEYARQIRNMLNKAGYQLGSGAGFTTALVPPNEPEFGQFLGVHDSDTPPPFAGGLQKALIDIKIQAAGSSGNFIPNDEVWVFVGKKPE